MKKSLGIILVLSCFLSFLSGQSAPTAEPVYGGYVEHLDILAVSPDSSRVFVTTLSDNTMFYSDIDHSGSSPVIGMFYPVPDLDSDDGFGQDVRCIAAHSNSGYVIAATSSEGLISLDHRVGSRQVIDTRIVEWISAWRSDVYYLTQGSGIEITKAPVNSDGSLGTPVEATVVGTYSGTQRPVVTVAPDSLIYVMIPGAPPEIYVSNVTADGLTSSSLFSLLPVGDLSLTGHEYLAMAVLPGGRIVVTGYEGTSASSSTFAAYTDDQGNTWTTFDLPGLDCGRGAPYIAYGGVSSPYSLYFGRMMNNSNGDSSAWTFLPRTSSGTPVMDGPFAVDPNDQDVLFMRTDWGVGSSIDGAVTIHETNEGLTAVQVDDFAMSVDKQTAWVASKSGIWHVTDYLSTPVWNSTPYWPREDSTPYRSVATTADGDTVYVGNQSGRVFRYVPSSGTLCDSNFTEIFSANDYGFTYGSYISSIAIDTFTTGKERIAIGIVDEQDHGETETQGGLFIGEYSAGSWAWYPVTGGDIPSTGADVNDVIFMHESGRTVLYAGVDYHYSASTGTARSVYKVDSLDTIYNITQSMQNDTQNISASITTLVDGGNDTLYVCGTDAGTNHPTIYKKGLTDSVWVSLTSGAVGLPADAEATGLTTDPTGTLYIAVANKIYTLSPGASAWTDYYEYPYGTMINFLFYDELLVGTGTGLYAHDPQGSSIKDSPDIIHSFEFKSIVPNPFNPVANINFELESDMPVSAMIYNIRGRLVALIPERSFVAGSHSIQWQAGDLVSGIYIVRLRVGDNVACKKCTLLK